MISRILTRSLMIVSLFCCSGCQGTIYFPTDSYHFILGPNIEPNATVAEVVALSKNPSRQTVVIVYSLEAERLEGHCMAKNDGAKVETQQLFRIGDSTMGRVKLTKRVRSYDMLKGCSFKLLIQARAEFPLHAETIMKDNLNATLMSTLTSQVDIIKTSVDIQLPQDSLRCFAMSSLRLQMYMSTPYGLVYVLNPRLTSADISFEYNLIQDNTDDHLIFDNQSSGITVFDIQGQPRDVFMSVECLIRMTLQSNTSFERIATISEIINISVTFLSEKDPLLSPIYLGSISLDVRENRVQKNSLTSDSMILPNELTYGWTTPVISISSLEDTANDSYTADYRKTAGNIIVELKLLKTLPYILGAVHHLNVTVRNDPMPSYNEPSNWTDIPARTSLIYSIDVHIHAMEFKFENLYSEVTVYRNASALSRAAIVSVPTYVSNDRTIVYSLRLPGAPGDSIRLGQNSGILYISNESQLQATRVSSFNLTLYAMDITDEFDETIKANATVEVQLIDADPNNCFNGVHCSKYFTKKDCISTSCAYGSPNGWCKWRPDTTSSRFRNGSYGTCSPDLSSCPDNTCDEIEQTNVAICLQDCTTKVIGMFPFRKKDSSDSLGIAEGAGIGVCKCDMLNVEPQCNCFRPMQPRTEPPLNIATFKPIQENSVENVVTIPNPVPSEVGPCNILCIIVLTSVICVFLSLFIVGLLASKRYPCSGRVAGTQYKPGLIGPPDGLLNTVPSEYVDDGFMLQRIKSEYDAKWEFPRTNLILEDVLGEGEFGRVMMAQALSISGHTGYQTVAVKMLKNNATNAELQDLITELSLLKQVNHQNVIQLLGASTQKGPLFVIVEYCKHGSLKSFLRLHRKNSIPSDNYMHPEERTITIGPRDLISFAWQVCKGMHYLASMKLVHRDLAARNVLVSEGLIIKISDFGLTRDIYEGDTYMKKSKSRMPVKWMAIEALYDNVYTIKSDIWSFGILLWEIVTMGATPYPGLPSERLYQILKNGYRMEKPDGCSDELFRIMQRCWQLVPSSRSSFHELADVFEKMLEKNSHYFKIPSPNSVCHEQYTARYVAQCGIAPLPAPRPDHVEMRPSFILEEYLDLSAAFPIDSDNESNSADDQIDTSAAFRPVTQINEEEETSLKVLLSNAPYSVMPPSASKSSDHETSFTGSPMETDQECIGDEESYYCGELMQSDVV